MIRGFLAALLVLIVCVAAGAWYVYGETDPCRMLAVERARRAGNATDMPIRGAVELWTRAETGQMSEGECLSGLMDSWGERISAIL